jgi:hypothetical protein
MAELCCQAHQLLAIVANFAHQYHRAVHRVGEQHATVLGLAASAAKEVLLSLLRHIRLGLTLFHYYVSLHQPELSF